MNDSVLLIDKQEGIATVTLNRPKVMNAYSTTLSEGIELELKIHHEVNHGYVTRFDASRRIALQQRGRDQTKG